MNELDYDAMQKKRLARSAQHRVCGAKSRKCSLPSDNLTDAQKRALDGPVQSWNPTMPITWDTFKSMPRDLQQEHLDYIQDRFQLGLATISTQVFAMGRMALAAHCKRHGLSYQTFRGTPSAEKLNRLEDWVEDRGGVLFGWARTGKTDQGRAGQRQTRRGHARGRGKGDSQHTAGRDLPHEGQRKCGVPGALGTAAWQGNRLNSYL